MCRECDSLDVMARGLCTACYMRDRRRRLNGGVARRKSGDNEEFAMQHVAEWQPRFLSKIEERESGCFEWTGGKTNGGYGVFNFGSRTILAHRLAYRLVGGERCDVIMHKCDNPCCVNPSHLAGGTAADNMADMDAKGRRVVSEAKHLRNRQTHPRAKAVRTPAGDFASAALASEAIGVGARTIQKRCARGAKGYGYL